VSPGLFVGLATLDVVQRVDRPPGPDEKVVATRADVAAGGPATGAAVTFAALGGDAVLLTALGRGPLADLVRQDLEQHGVRVLDAAPSSGGPAVSAVTVVESTGERSVVSRNAEDVDASMPQDVEVLLDGCGVLLVDGHHARLAVAAARAARARGIPVVLDAGSWKPVLAELLPLTTMAVCSSAFRLPDGRPPLPGLLDAGPSFVAVTAGAQPVQWATRQDRGTVDVPAVQARDSLGAGDVFHGAYAHAVASGADPVAALRRGVAVASVRVTHVGPRSWLSDAGLSGAGLPGHPREPVA
jgi:sugar/nucleoside kinase (ribokinase family)